MWELNWFNLWKLSKEKFWKEYPLILAITDEYVEKHKSIVERHKYINLYALMLAVRKQENGKPGLEFGVMAAKGTDLEEQARWAVVTFLKNIERWERAVREGNWKPKYPSRELDYIAYLGNRWAPVGASNDPAGLNQYWIPNVQRLYLLYKR
ncbi:MAG: hypothetical protein QM228_02970 [Atribacterota bacterium]|nr:hypothetical protein [Atribacterota bacterium]